jgi:hypothetical protein
MWKKIKEEFGFGLTEMTWKGESQFWPDWNDLQRRKLVLARLEWLEMVKVGFSLTGMIWNGGSQFWHDCNGLESKKSLINLLDCLGMEEVIFCQTGMIGIKEVGFDPTGMAWNGGSRFWPAWNGKE